MADGNLFGPSDSPPMGGFSASSSKCCWKPSAAGVVSTASAPRSAFCATNVTYCALHSLLLPASPRFERTQRVASRARTGLENQPSCAERATWWLLPNWVGHVGCREGLSIPRPPTIFARDIAEPVEAQKGVGPRKHHCQAPFPD